MTNSLSTPGTSDVWDEFSHAVIGCAIKVHRIVGCILLESAYEECLSYELVKNGFSIARQVVLPIEYDGVRIDAGYKPGGIEVGLLMNFHAHPLMKGIKRLVLTERNA